MPPDEQGVRDVNNSSFSEAKRYYRELLRVAEPATLDIAGYAMLLMTAGQLDESERIVNRLSPTGDGPLVALQLRVQIAVRRNQDVQQVTSDWIESVKREGAFTEEQAWIAAGQTLTQLGFAKEALHFIEKAYTRNPGEYLKPYTLQLSASGQSEKAIDLCMKRLKAAPDVATASLLADLAVRNQKLCRQDKYRQGPFFRLSNVERICLFCWNRSRPFDLAKIVFWRQSHCTKWWKPSSLGARSP